jgi:anti-anti-sigma regulatory factor
MAAKLKTVRDKGGDIRLLRLNPRGHRLFTVAKLHTAFEIFNDEAMAVRSFDLRPR